MALFKFTFLLATVALMFGFASAVTYPYTVNQECVVSNLNISELVGDWKVLYHKNSHDKKMSVSFVKLDNNTLDVSYKEDGNVIRTFNLTQVKGLPGVLEELVRFPSYSLGYPTFVMAHEPGKYLTMHHVKQDGVEDFAIYGKESQLSESDYGKALKGLKCGGAVQENDPKLFKMPQ